MLLRHRGFGKGITMKQHSIFWPAIRNLLQVQRCTTVAPAPWASLVEISCIDHGAGAAVVLFHVTKY